MTGAEKGALNPGDLQRLHLQGDCWGGALVKDLGMASSGFLSTSVINEHCRRL
jgi:hypothetical protein